MTQTKHAWRRVLSVFLCCALCLTSYVFFAPTASAIVTSDTQYKKADQYGTQPWDGSGMTNYAKWYNGEYWIQINYAPRIYLDVSETLQSAGYKMGVSWRWGASNPSESRYRIVLTGAVWGDNETVDSGLPASWLAVSNLIQDFWAEGGLWTTQGNTCQANDSYLKNDNYTSNYNDRECIVWRSGSDYEHNAYAYLFGTPRHTGTATYSTAGNDLVFVSFNDTGGWSNKTVDRQKGSQNDANFESNVVIDGWKEISYSIVVYDKAALNSEIEKAEAFQAAFSRYADNVVAGDWSAFESALAEAKRLLTTREVEQQQLDNAQTALRNAGNALKFNVNVSALQSAMAAAEAKLSEADLADRYTSDSISALQTALNEAKAYSTPSDWNPYPNNSTSQQFNDKANELSGKQSEVDQLTSELQSALADLLGRADFSKFDEHIAANPDPGKCWTADSLAAYNTAVAKVQTLKGNTNLSVKDQAQVDTAIDEYLAAYANLKEQHSYAVTGEVVKEPTCTETGIERHTCTICGVAYQDTEIPMVEHTIDPEHPTASFAGDCRNKPWTEYTCSVCQQTVRYYGELDSTAHVWDAGVVKTAPTCTTEGVKTYTCTVDGCGETKEESIPPDGVSHVESDRKNIIPPTCEKDGVIQHLCEYCDAVLSTEKGEPALGHDYSVEIASTPGDCVTPATQTMRCSRCDATQVFTGAVNPDDHAGPIVTISQDDPENGLQAFKAATCVTPGYTGDKICNACHVLVEKGEEIAINPNNHESTETYITGAKEATCTEEGYSGDVYYSCCKTLKEQGHELPMIAHDYQLAETVAATCTARGYKLWKCSVCGAEEKRNETPIDPDNHTGSPVLDPDSVTARPADCTADGYNTGDTVYSCCGDLIESGWHEAYASHAWSSEGEEQADGGILYHCTHEGCQETFVESHVHSGGVATCVSPAICSECGKAYGEIDPSNHAGVVAIEALPATCTTAGHEAGEKCNACGVDLSGLAEIPALGHDFDHNNPAKMEVIQEGTCSAKEVIRYFCNRCDDATAYQDVVGDYNPDNHVNTIETEAIAPTCTTAGYTAGEYCNDCGQYVSGHKLIPALGHNYDGATHTEIETAATCIKPATLRVYCVNCDESYIIMEDPEATLDPDNHVNTDNTPAVDATCTTDGYTAGVYCNDCGKYVSGHEVIPASGHKTEWVVVSGSCTEGVVRELRCTVCGEVFERETLPATGHQIGEWTIVSEATCTEPGLRQAVCSVCGEAVTEVIPATGHVYDDGVLILHPEDSETGVGLMRYTCTKCGYTMDKEITDTGHIHHGGTATCVDRAVCVECNREYGDYDPNNHVHVVAMPDAEPTCETAGHTGGTYCDACGAVVTPPTETSPATGHVDENGDGFCDIDGKPILPDEPETPSDPDDDDSIWGGFRCSMCDIYEANKDIPVIGFFYMIVHFFVHIIGYIKFITG